MMYLFSYEGTSVVRHCIEDIKISWNEMQVYGRQVGSSNAINQCFKMAVVGRGWMLVVCVLISSEVCAGRPDPILSDALGFMSRSGSESTRLRTFQFNEFSFYRQFPCTRSMGKYACPYALPVSNAHTYVCMYVCMYITYKVHSDYIIYWKLFILK